MIRFILIAVVLFLLVRMMLRLFIRGMQGGGGVFSAPFRGASDGIPLRNVEEAEYEEIESRIRGSGEEER
jgi:hypothetical protein